VGDTRLGHGLLKSALQVLQREKKILATTLSPILLPIKGLINRWQMMFAVIVTSFKNTVYF
jgi:hypothetical protein